jgi:NADH-quinone oxidoreductase subunit M
MLWMVKRVFWGPENTDPESGTAHLNTDLNIREIAVMTPLVILIFWMGLHHVTFTGASEARVTRMLDDAGAPAARVLILSTPARAQQEAEQGVQQEMQQEEQR